ncbi:MAG: FxsA family protein [Schwartzia sp.]|nr:FxsA family protein [Schwartzia sp. (in: firmicutes)]
MNMLERLILFGGGLLMIIPGAVTDFGGLAVFLISVALQKKRKSSEGC